MDKKIKVLHIIGRYPKGGVGTFLKNMNSNIDLSKIQFDYLINESVNKNDFEIEVSKYGGKVYKLPKLSYVNTFKYLKALKKHYKENNEYIAVHVHSVNIALFNFYFAKKNGIKNLIAHSHSTKSSDSISKRIRNYFLLLPVKVFATNFFACSKEAAIFLFGKKNFSNNKVKIIKNAINTNDFSFNPKLRSIIRNKYSWNDKIVIGHVGNFIPVKNHVFLIDIFMEIYNANNNAILVLVGEGELLENIKSKVNRLGIEASVIFLGVRKDVNYLMQGFDTFLLPSKYEGVPLVGVEAQASGLPCFLSKDISKEIVLTNLVEFLDIRAKPKVWANEILDYLKTNQRNNTVKSIISSGYDIRMEAKKLEQYYKQLKL